MSKTNRRRPPISTHEGGKARRINPGQQLRRSVMSCMLWEREFYEDGVSIAERIAQLVPKCNADEVQAIAIEARENMKLRHAPLWIVHAMAACQGDHRLLVADTLSRVIQRADELTEFVSLYWLNGKRPLSAQVKKGLALAFPKFTAHQLAKYNRDGEVKLRDVLFLCHAKPKDEGQAETWRELVDGVLSAPDTWEVALSDNTSELSPRQKWERLLQEDKLGALALLRNLRNMGQAEVNPKLVKAALAKLDTKWVLPFRFITAARHNVKLEPELESCLFRCVEERPKLDGRTVLLVDVSQSMEWPLSGRTELNRMDAACGLTMLARELCEECEVWTFSNNLVQVPARRGFALRDAVVGSQRHGGTALGGALKRLLTETGVPHRLIVVTDEQTNDRLPGIPAECRAYMLNVASAQNGVGYGDWIHMDGFSEAVLDYILEVEKEG